MQRLQPVTQRGISLWVQMAVAVEREADRGMPRTYGDLLGRRTGGDPQRHRGVAKVVDAQALQAGCQGSRHPKARPKAPDPQRPPTGGGEDVAAGPLCGGKMCLQLADDEGRQPDGPAAGTRLGRPGDQLAVDLGEDLGHGDRPGPQIDPAWAEPDQLPDPQAAVGTHEYQRPVADMDRLGQLDDLGGGEKAYLLPLDLRQRHIAA